VRGLRRVEAFVNEAPARVAIERTATYQYLGLFHLTAQRFAEAAHAFAQGEALLPSLHLMRQRARAELLAGNPRAARDIYRGMVERDPGYLFGWHMLMQVEYQLGNRDSSRSAARAALRLDPADVPARDLLEALGAEDVAHAPAR
jgi:tetratricopeptide (TPR) repeat protein